MTTVNDRVLWLDLETSGSDEQEDGAAILELGIVITDIYGFREVAATNWVYGLDELQLKYLPKWDPVVIDMHSTNGLLGEVLKSDQRPDYNAILNWIEKNIDKSVEFKFQRHKNEPKIPLGGSGVAHFDSRWLREFLPGFADHLTYWAYDVGVLRRVFEMASPRNLILQRGKNHRALDDTRQAIEQFRHYYDLIRQLS